jgi:MFS family permease
MGKLVFGRYDYAAFLAFAAYAMCSMAVPMCLVPLAAELRFPLDDGGMGLGGALQIARSIPMVAAMLLCGFISGVFGKRRALGASLLLMALGIAVCSAAPAYGVLFAALIVSGLGEGVLEGLATPFVQDLHPDQPGRYLNFSHAFWSVGIVFLVLIAGALLSWGVSWRLVMLFSGLSALVPAALLLLPSKQRSLSSERFVKTHWRDVCRDAWAIMRVKRFWLFFAAMFFAGGGEFCLTFWCASFIQLEYGGSAWAAGAGTAFFSAGMIVGRIGSGWLVRQGGLKTLIVATGFAATAVTLPFPWLQSLWALFVLLFLAGIAAGPFWPSIQSDGTHRVRGDHTMMMIMFSCAGVPGCGFFTFAIGLLGDWAGLRMSFFIVPACFLVVFLLMGYDLLSERRESRAKSL